MLDWTHHPEVESEEAWEQLQKADVTKDIDDIREAFEIYCRNTPTAELQAIEQRLRAEEMNLHLVAMEKDLPSNKTNVDLQNNMDRTYSVVLQLSARSKRSKQMTSMLASSAEENFARLADCGFIVKSPIPVCFKCSCKGHRSAECTSDIIPEQSRKVIIICSNCGEEGHRLRVCPQPRKDDLCRNCGEPGHKAVDCEAPRRPREGDTCNNCGSGDHFARDCPEPRVFRCRRCNEPGHKERECPESMDIDDEPEAESQQFDAGEDLVPAW